ncbi:MAG: gliding motility-associated C-terminal domain-containing protein [Gelidibacter sp.]
MKKTTIPHFYNQFIVALLFVMGATVNSFAQCPTVTIPTLSFCDVETPTLATLSIAATNNGGGIKWYATANSTIALSLTQGLENGKRYFADNNSGTCGTRQSVLVTIYGVPLSLPFQGVCVDYPEEATISDLIAFGNDVQWYDVATGGSPLLVSTVLTNETTYYVNQSNPDTGCRTSRLSVLVKVGVVPVPTGDPVQLFCEGSNPTVADLVASGTNKWYGTISSGTILPLSTPLVHGETYYATTFDSPCESVERFQVKVEIVPLNNAGNNGEIEICETGVASTNTVNLFEALLGSPDTSGTWTGPRATSHGNIGTVDVSTMTVAGSPYVFTYAVSSASCPTATATVSIMVTESGNPGTDGTLSLCVNSPAQDLFASLQGNPEPGGTWSPALASGTGIFDVSKDSAGVYTYTVYGVPPCGPASATVTVTISAEPLPGTNGNLTLCSNSAPENLFNSLGGSPQSGGTWTPALASGTGVFDPSQDAAGIYTYTVFGTAPCGDASATVTVNITQLPNPGTNGSLALCITDGLEDLYDSLGGTPETGGTWSPALASGTGFFDPSKDTPGIYTYTISGVSPCGAASAIVNVTVNPKAQPGTNGSISLCSDSAAVNLFDSLGGSPQSGGTWSPILVSGTGVFDPSQDAPGTYTYTISGIAPCGDAFSTVTVTVNPLANAGTNGSLILCSSDPSQDLFNSLGGTPDAGGTWFPALASGTGVFDPSQDAAGTYTYTITTDCEQASATVEVTVNPQADPGINGNLALCIDGNPEDLYNRLGGTPQSGGIWLPALASGTGLFDPKQDAAGTYTYTVSGITPCGTATATVTVTVDTAPQAGLNGRFAICTNDAPQDLFDSLGGTPETGGTWSPALASGSGIFDPAQDNGGSYTYTVTNACGTDSAIVTVALIPQPDLTGLTLSANAICLDDDITINLSGATQLSDGNYNLTYSLAGANSTEQTITVNITNGSSNIYIPASQLTTIGTTTFTILNLLNPITNCGTASGTLPTVDFNIEHAGTPELVNEGNIFCEDESATIADLTSQLIGADIITWYDAIENGTAYTRDTPLVDGTTYFASNMTLSGCGNDVRLAVRVTIDLCEPLEIIIPDGFSPNGDNINDDFFIKNLRELYPNFKLQIYNRYGNILYKGDINTPNWDGTSNHGRALGNGVLPVGVYYYILELKDTNNKTIQGSVYLNR